MSTQSTPQPKAPAEPGRTREWLLLLGFLLLCAAGVATVLLPETRDDADPSPGSGAAGAEASPNTARP